MKTSISLIVSLAFLLGLFSCESIGVGPKQDSQVNFEFVNADGEAIYPDHLAFSLPQFNVSTPYENFGAPSNHSQDSAWVGRVIYLDTSPIGILDSLNSISLSLHFFQKEVKDLLVINDKCNCLDYPDATSFAERFFVDGKQLGANHSIAATYRRTFSLFESREENSQVNIKAIKQVDNTLFIKGDFEFGFGNSPDGLKMQNGDFQLEIPF